MLPGAAPKLLLGLTGLHIDGGIAGVSRCVARALDEEARAERVARADRVLLLDLPSSPPPPPARGEQRLARGSQPRFTWQLWRAWRQQRPDLVFFDLVGLARACQLPLPGFPPPRIAIFVHGIELQRARGGPRERALRGAWRILVNSAFTKRTLLAAAPELAEKVRVARLCIDPERVAAWEASGLGEPGPGPRRSAVLIVGRMMAAERGKGHDELLECWPALRRTVAGAELWVVGGGNDLARLEAKARGLGIGAAVRFFGRVTDAELGRLYREAALFAMPSCQEGFGLVYAEAMWHGLPCVGSTADAASDVVEDGRTGLLVPYGDAEALGGTLAELLAHPERLDAMRGAARERARREFGYARFRRDLLAALELGPGASETPPPDAQEGTARIP